jgi:conjugative relaxase-like TrwC/TraI family protein
MRVTTIYAGSAATTAKYYTQYLTQAVGEEPGCWLGTQAAEFGLSGQVSTEALKALLSGCDPATGAPLGRALADRFLTSGKVVKAVAGFDATLSAPKSLSVAWVLTGDPGLVECHDAAVRAVVAELERFGATTRVRANGARLHPDTRGLTVAAFRQTTSRVDDPQLHTHVVHPERLRDAERLVDALDTWKEWAQGHPVDRDQLADTVEALTQGPDASIDGSLALADVLRRWAHHNNSDIQPHRTQNVERPDLGIELGF